MSFFISAQQKNGIKKTHSVVEILIMILECYLYTFDTLIHM